MQLQDHHPMRKATTSSIPIAPGCNLEQPQMRTATATRARNARGHSQAHTRCARPQPGAHAMRTATARRTCNAHGHSQARGWWRWHDARRTRVPRGCMHMPRKKHTGRIDNRPRPARFILHLDRGMNYLLGACPAITVSAASLTPTP